MFVMSLFLIRSEYIFNIALLSDTVNDTLCIPTMTRLFNNYRSFVDTANWNTPIVDNICFQQK